MLILLLVLLVLCLGGWGYGTYGHGPEAAPWGAPFGGLVLLILLAVLLCWLIGAY